MSEDSQSRRRGTLLGLAVGDALEATYEFCDPDEVPDGPLEMAGGGRPGLTDAFRRRGGAAGQRRAHKAEAGTL